MLVIKLNIVEIPLEVRAPHNALRPKFPRHACNDLSSRLYHGVGLIERARGVVVEAVALVQKQCEDRIG